MAKFKVGDRVKTNGGYSFDPGIGTVVKAGDGDDLYFVDVDGEEGPGCDPGWAYSDRDLVAVAPATATIEFEFAPFPQVGDAVLIPGVISAVNHSPRGTNYNIVFETQNRRVSLHFLEEDFIVDPEQGDGDCPCANDNGPAPSTDTAKAFDAMGAWLRSLAVSRAA